MISTSCVAEELSPLNSILNKEIFINDTWAGQSVTLKRENSRTYLVCHLVYGSGIPVTSAKLYTAEKQSDSQVRFSIPNNDSIHYFILNALPDGKVRLFLDGYELKIKELRVDYPYMTREANACKASLE